MFDLKRDYKKSDGRNEKKPMKKSCYFKFATWHSSVWNLETTAVLINIILGIIYAEFWA